MATWQGTVLRCEPMHRGVEFQGYLIRVRFEIRDGGQVVDTVTQDFLYELTDLVGLTPGQIRQLVIQTGPPVPPVDPPAVPPAPYPPPMLQVGARLLAEYEAAHAVLSAPLEP